MCWGGEGLTGLSYPWWCAQVGMNRLWGLGPKVAGAAAGFGEQRESVVELVEAAAVPDGDWSDLPSVGQLWLQATRGRGRSGDEDGSSNAQARSFGPFVRRSGLARGAAPVDGSLGLAALRRRS
jgi:hypothetical protein